LTTVAVTWLAYQEKTSLTRIRTTVLEKVALVRNSDGKLYTRSKKRGSVDRILQIFNQFGASENILIDAHPHIGSDKLPAVIKAMRQQILKSGGDVRFSTRVTGLKMDGMSVVGVVCEDGSEFDGPVILATGHSARDVYRMLDGLNIEIEAKGIAVGVRLEHPQKLIDQIQYHSSEGRGEWSSCC